MTPQCLEAVSVKRSAFSWNLATHVSALFIAQTYAIDLCRLKQPSRTARTVAPVIAEIPGARGAGQGRASGERSERSLDAPKRSRIIETGATTLGSLTRGLG